MKQKLLSQEDQRLAFWTELHAGFEDAFCVAPTLLIDIDLPELEIGLTICRSVSDLLLEILKPFEGNGPTFGWNSN